MQASKNGRGRPVTIVSNQMHYCAQKVYHADPEKDDYFQSILRRGGPVDPITNFEQLYDLILKHKYNNQTL